MDMESLSRSLAAWMFSPSAQAKIVASTPRVDFSSASAGMVEQHHQPVLLTSATTNVNAEQVERYIMPQLPHSSLVQLRCTHHLLQYLGCRPVAQRVPG